MASFGVRCAFYGSGGFRMARLCCDINKRDTINLATQFEARQKVDNFDPDGHWNNLQWRWFWIHLYRNGNLVRSEGSTGWMTGGDNTYSTNWIDCSAFPRGANYRAVGRWQARAKENGGSGEWWYSLRTTLSSETRDLNCNA